MNSSNKANTDGAGPIARFSLLCVLLLAVTTLPAADPYTKTIDESFAAVPEVTFAQRNGPLEIRPSTDGKIRFVSRISIDAGDDTEGRRFLDKMELLSTASGNSLHLRLSLNEVSSWTTTNKRSVIKFADGEKIRGVRNFEVRSTLYLPPTQLLALSCRFGDIDMDSGTEVNDLTLELNNVNLRGGTVRGDLRVNSRFGSIRLESAGGRVSGELNNNRLELKQGGGEIQLNTRFSELVLGPVKRIELVSNNDEVEIESVSGQLELNERFGDYRLGTTGDAIITSNNGDYRIEKGGAYTINGRFMDMNFGELTSLKLTGNSNCDYRIEQLEEVRGDARFTDIRVDRFTGRADLDLTNGSFHVDELTSSFTGIEVAGRFFEVDVRLPDQSNYQAKAYLTFGKFNVPDELTPQLDKERGSEMEKHFLSLGATESSPTIEVTGTNGSLRIR